VRRDLPLGAIAAQLIHAAGASASGHSVPDDTHAVALAVPDEASLLVLETQLQASGVLFHAVREPDAPYLNALMAIGIPPQQREALRPLLRHLELLK
jgi:hypothetical protein